MGSLTKTLFDSSMFGQAVNALNPEKAAPAPVSSPSSTANMPTYDDIYLMETRRKAARASLNRDSGTTSDPTKVGVMK